MPLIETGTFGDLPYVIWEQGGLGHLCGYLGVPASHPWYERDYDQPDVDIHGGLTYASAHDPGDGSYESPVKAWWVGFDCAHLGDYVPGLGKGFGDGAYRDRDYVHSELEGLARQASEAWNEAVALAQPDGV